MTRAEIEDELRKLGRNRALFIHFSFTHSKTATISVFISGILKSPVMKFQHPNTESNYSAAKAAILTFPRHTNAGLD